MRPEIIIVLVVIFVLILAAIFFYFIRRKIAMQNIIEALKSLEGEKKLEICTKKPYQIYFKWNNRVYLIKVIYFFTKGEISVNSKDFWQVNHGAVSSRKKGEKMSKVYDLIDFNLKENGFQKDTIKLHIVYPKASSLVKVINECEMVFIKPDTDIYGTKMINYSDIKEQFQNIK